MEEGRVKYSLMNGATGLFTQLIIIILGLLTRSLFVNYLGTEITGLNGTFTNILSVLSVTELGIGSAITYCLYKPIYDNDKEKIAGIMNLFRKAYIVIGSVILLGSICVTPFIQYFIKDYTLDLGYIRLIFILYAINSVITYFMGYCRILFIASQKNYVVTFVDFIAKLVLQLVQVFILIYVPDSIKFIIYLVLGGVSNFVSNLVIRKKYAKEYEYLKNNKTKIDDESKKKIINTIKYLSISSLISVGVFGTDSLIISSIISVTVSGVYSNYTLIIGYVQTLFTSLLNGVTASLGNMMAEGDKQKINRIFNIYDFAYFVVGSFVAVCLFNMLNPFIGDILIRKEGYTLGIYVVAMLVFNSYVTYKRQPVWQFQNTAGIFKYFIPYSLLELVLHLGIGIFAAIKFGLIGLFVGTAISSVVSWIGQTCVLHKRVLDKKSTKYIFKQIGYMLLTVVEILIVYFVAKYIKLNSAFINFIFITILCLIVPNGINILLFHKTYEFNYLKDNILKKILKLKRK